MLSPGLGTPRRWTKRAKQEVLPAASMDGFTAARPMSRHPQPLTSSTASQPLSRTDRHNTFAPWVLPTTPKVLTDKFTLLGLALDHRRPAFGAGRDSLARRAQTWRMGTVD